MSLDVIESIYNIKENRHWFPSFCVLKYYIFVRLALKACPAPEFVPPQSLAM